LAGSQAAWPWGSPVGERMTMGDVCYYKPGDLNKLGKEGRTSWDSFAYFLMMGHNVYQHIESVQRANALNDTACVLHKPDPGLWAPTKGKNGELSNWVPRNVIYITELVNRVFTSETPFTELDRAQSLLADFNGKKTLKSTAATHSMLFAKEDKGNDNDSENVEAWDEDEATEILKQA
jgi:hypothetical protein